MPGFASLFRRSLRSREAFESRSGDTLQPFGHAADHTGARSDDDPPAGSETPGHWSRNSAERLERIATYARAGYFNIGYTYEMFHLSAELPPE
jgi:hypothetical protein